MWWFTGKYELCIFWSNGERQSFVYDDANEAIQAEKNMLTAFGNQILWSCVRAKIK